MTAPKGFSDRGIRTPDSGAEDRVPLEDGQAGDEGIDDTSSQTDAEPDARGPAADEE
jgi:hypothetical protein